MKNILLATDLAAETDRALERALALATAMAAKLHVLHVCPAYSFSDKKKSTSILRQGAEDKLKRYLAGFTDLNDLKPTIHVVESREVFLEIIQCAEKIRAGLIVMGMHGKAKLQDLFVGTTVERVIRKGIKPVLMVKDKPIEGYQNVLVGTDFSAGAKKALRVALELAPQSSFHLVHSYDIPDTYIGVKISQYAGDVVEKAELDKLEHFVKGNLKIFKKYGIDSKKLQYRIIQGDVLQCLMHEVDFVKAELLAIGTHSRATLMPYKLGGTAHDILCNPPCDVLVSNGH